MKFKSAYLRYPSPGTRAPSRPVLKLSPAVRAVTVGPGASGFESGASGTGQRLSLATGINSKTFYYSGWARRYYHSSHVYCIKRTECTADTVSAAHRKTGGFPEAGTYSEDWFLKPPGRARVAVTTLAWFFARHCNFCKAPKVAF